MKEPSEKKDDTYRIIRVQFFRPVHGRTDYYFGSKKAVFDAFTDEQIGITLNTLRTKRLDTDSDVVTRNCRITKEYINRSKQHCNDR